MIKFSLVFPVRFCCLLIVNVLKVRILHFLIDEEVQNSKIIQQLFLATYFFFNFINLHMHGVAVKQLES